jgi:hypothetical protein
MDTGRNAGAICSHEEKKGEPLNHLPGGGNLRAAAGVCGGYGERES